jgi:hypothetical protein
MIVKSFKNCYFFVLQYHTQRRNPLMDVLQNVVSFDIFVMCRLLRAGYTFIRDRNHRGSDCRTCIT